MAESLPPAGLLYDYFLIFTAADQEIAGALYEALDQRSPGRIMPDLRAIPPGADLARAFRAVVASSRVIVVLVSPRCDAAFGDREDIRLAVSAAQAGRARVVPVLVDAGPEALAGARLEALAGVGQPVSLAGPEDARKVAEALLPLVTAGPRLPRPTRVEVEELEKLLVEKHRQRRRDTRVAELMPKIDLMAQAITAGALVRAGDLVAGARLVRCLGTDSFATTWYARREGSGEPCLVKQFRLERLTHGMLLFGFRRALEALRQLNARPGAPRGIVRIGEVEGDTLAFSTEFVPEGGIL